MTEWSLITDNKNPLWLLSDHVDTGVHIDLHTIIEVGTLLSHGKEISILCEFSQLTSCKARVTKCSGFCGAEGALSKWNFQY